MTIWHLHRARWITVATETHSEYVIPIVLLLQQWLHECASMLRLRTLPVLFNLDRIIFMKFHLSYFMEIVFKDVLRHEITEILSSGM